MVDQLPATTDLTIERILSPLIDVFPGGATAERVRIYADLLRPENFTPGDVRDGVSRLIHVWERTTFPPFAKLLSCCNDARELRLTVERLKAKKLEDGQRFRKLPQELLDAQLAEIRAFRVKVMPKRKPSVRTGRKRCYSAPLTREEIERANRKKRERARHAKAATAVPPSGTDDAA